MDVDEQARRNLATEVSNAVVEGGRVVGIGPVAEIARGASAVVLASDLRAPALTRAEFVRQLTERVASGEAMPVVYGVPVKADASVPPGEVRVCAEAQMGRPPCPRVSPNRQDWRARLANVERLLGEFSELYYSHRAEMPPLAAQRFMDALREVRAMLDNPAGGEG